MDFSWLSRTELLIGRERLERLVGKHVLVLGMGGVGSFAAEFIARSGVGRMTIVDGDVVDPSNRNRQLPALATTHGQSKVEWMAERIRAINPEITLNAVKEFVRPEAIDALLDTDADYVIDAIDSVTPKLTCIKSALAKEMRIVSSMGAGGRVDPSKIVVTDISKTYNCPFAQHIRKHLKVAGIRRGLTVVSSTELPDRESIIHTDGTNFKKSAYGTISYMPAMFGATAASVVIRNLMEQ
ncbi:tRNA threonylcarbamoyladenosine dehydratase [Rurimicrobium arvi]|uniref:tRNA threonylcarbamoyladenosine dehydratase n=1 Tax=Rurimicrobium arvi TaxID=2049916 RepID=A0ABP8MKZ1_9BACT